MVARKQLKLCKACFRSFTPQLSDHEMKLLFYDQETIDKVDFLLAEWPGAYRDPLHVPYQVVCEKCLVDPRLEVYHSFLGGPQFRLRPEDPKPEKKAKKKKP